MVKELSINVAKDYTGYTGNYNHVFAGLGPAGAIMNKEAQKRLFLAFVSSFYPFSPSSARILREPSAKEETHSQLRGGKHRVVRDREKTGTRVEKGAVSKAPPAGRIVSPMGSVRRPRARDL
jgi:hypothetical protein